MRKMTLNNAINNDFESKNVAFNRYKERVKSTIGTFNTYSSYRQAAAINFSEVSKNTKTNSIVSWCSKSEVTKKGASLGTVS
jgi:hypothetical protein